MLPSSAAASSMRSNKRETSFPDSENHLEKSECELTSISWDAWGYTWASRMERRWARALQRVVFPVPGGPCSKMTLKVASQMAGYKQSTISAELEKSVLDCVMLRFKRLILILKKQFIKDVSVNLNFCENRPSLPRTGWPLRQWDQHRVVRTAGLTSQTASNRLATATKSTGCSCATQQRTQSDILMGACKFSARINIR